MVGVDTSFYNTQQPPPVNALTQVGNLVQLRNALLQGQVTQQQVQQQQMQTQMQNAKIKGLQMLNDPQYINPADSTLDTNKWIGDMAKNPETAIFVPEAMGMRDTLNAPIKSGGVDANGNPIYSATQVVGAKFNPSSGASQTNAPSATMEAPQGFTTPLAQSRTNYNQVNADANNAPDKLAAFGEVENLNNQGTLTGTRISDAYQQLAKTGLVSQGITDKAAQTQEIGKYIQRIVVGNGLPDSDYRSQVLESSNLTPEQLSETIKDLEPFMKASTQGLVAKQKYYNQQTKNGTDLTAEPVASQTWNQHYDPRWLEFDSLPDKKAQRAFLVQHPDMIQKKQNYQALQNMGVVGGQ